MPPSGLRLLGISIYHHACSTPLPPSTNTHDLIFPHLYRDDIMMNDMIWCLSWESIRLEKKFQACDVKHYEITFILSRYIVAGSGFHKNTATIIRSVDFAGCAHWAIHKKQRSITYSFSIIIISPLSSLPLAGHYYLLCMYSLVITSHY